jgi:hypothetical protein
VTDMSSSTGRMLQTEGARLSGGGPQETANGRLERPLPREIAAFVEALARVQEERDYRDSLAGAEVMCADLAETGALVAQLEIRGR